MGHKIPPKEALAMIQIPRQCHGEKHQQQKGIVSRHNPCNPLAIKASPGWIRLPLHHVPGIGKKKQKSAEENGTVHRHIPGAHQKIQRCVADARRPPALLPNVIPANDKHQQYPKTIQLRYARLVLDHGLLLFPCHAQIISAQFNSLPIETFERKCFFPPSGEITMFSPHPGW